MPMVTSKRVRFTVKQYLRMCRAGVFGDRRVELLNGRVYEMAAQGDEHMFHMTVGNIVFARHFGDLTRFWPVSQGTVVLGRFGAPDPDFMIFDVPARTARRQRPLPFLVVEVSGSTYARDSGLKLRMYAAAGIEDYWIENLQEHRLEVYRRPSNPTGLPGDWRYDEVIHLLPGQGIAPIRYPQAVIAVADLMP